MIMRIVIFLHHIYKYFCADLKSWFKSSISLASTKKRKNVIYKKLKIWAFWAE